MRELLPVIEAWQGEGLEFGRAVLIRAFGSAPRPVGATLLVADDGRLAGSVSGGCVESACVEEVARARRAGRATVIRYGISDETAWSVGLACGGTVDVLIEPTVSDELVEAARAAGARVVVTRLPADSPRGEEAPQAALDDAVRRALSEGRSRVALTAEGQQFVEAFPTPPRLIVFGAVDMAMSLVRLGHELGYRVLVVDARPAFATAERFANADELLLGWPEEVADRLALGPADAVVVLTHDPKLDDPAIVLAARAGCRYVGAIGSRRTQQARRARLRDAGLADREIDAVHGPIGLDLGGREPAEVALAIMAQVVASRYGAAGGPMSRR